MLHYINECSATQFVFLMASVLVKISALMMMHMIHIHFLLHLSERSTKRRRGSEQISDNTSPLPVLYKNEAGTSCAGDVRCSEATVSTSRGCTSLIQSGVSFSYQS